MTPMEALNPVKIVVFGRDHETKGEVCARALDSPTVAWAMSPGVASRPNEDGIGVSVRGGEIVLAIADGHWGRDASEIAVSKAVELLCAEVRPTRESETKARIFALYDQVNSELYRQATAAPGAPASETTLIVCHVREAVSGKSLYWSSFGDSYLFLLRGGQLRQLNTLNPCWLGYLSRLSENADSRSILMRFLSEEARYVGVASGLETGIEKLEQGDLLFLCTDGLIGSDRQPEESVLETIREVLTSGLPPGSRVEKVVASALGRGETDNISCVMTQID